MKPIPTFTRASILLEAEEELASSSDDESLREGPTRRQPLIRGAGGSAAHQEGRTSWKRAVQRCHEDKTAVAVRRAIKHSLWIIILLLLCYESFDMWFDSSPSFQFSIKN